MGKAGCGRLTCWIRSLPGKPAGAGWGRLPPIALVLGESQLSSSQLTDRGVLQLKGGVGSNG